MCVGFWSLDHPEYALLLCSNRDEVLSRPTVNAHFHSFGHPPADDPASGAGPVLSGRDLQAGGTWLGLNRYGRVALLTNITERAGHYSTSRGHLVSSFLLSHQPQKQYIADLTGPAQPAFAGFNLVLLSPSGGTPVSYDADLVTNSGGGGAIASRPLRAEERRVRGVSNGIDGRGGNEWPKVQVGQAALQQLISETAPGASEDELAGRLFDLLTWVASVALWQSPEPPSNTAQLRNSVQIEPFRKSHSLRRDAHADDVPEFYGTRLSTVLLVRRDGRVLFAERDIWQLDNTGRVTGGDPRSDRVFRFRLATEQSSQG